MKNNNLDEALKCLAGMPRNKLVETWRELLKTNPPRCASPKFLTAALAYAMQERASCGLPAMVRRQLRAIAQGKGNRSTQPSIKPGTVLIRDWRGTTYRVEVTNDGFAWSGKIYRSLSVIARTITGTQWNGRRFFGLTSRKGAGYAGAP